LRNVNLQLEITVLWCCSDIRQGEEELKLRERELAEGRRQAQEAEARRQRLLTEAEAEHKRSGAAAAAASEKLRGKCSRKKLDAPCSPVGYLPPLLGPPNLSAQKDDLNVLQAQLHLIITGQGTFEMLNLHIRCSLLSKGTVLSRATFAVLLADALGCEERFLLGVGGLVLLCKVQ
jgi:hypothetical protein